MKTNQKLRLRKGFTLVELLVVIAIIVALAALAGPEILKKRKAADMITSVNNGRQIYASLFSFEETYGTFPSEATVEEDEEFSGLDTQSSNGLLGQLVVFGASEKIFFAKGGGSISKKPDEKTAETSEILEQGECGFGYILVEGENGEQGMDSSGNTSRPVCVAPVDLEGGDSDFTFNPEPYDRKAVLVLLDGSVDTRQIGRRSKKITGGGGDPFDTDGDEEDSIWGSQEPKLVKPL